MKSNEEKNTVLIIDDDTANIEILSMLLMPEYRVLFTTKGARACEMAVQNNPDLILLDVVMPGIDGYSICRDLKTNPLTAHIPVIFVTAMGEEEYEATGFEAGGVDYVTKPVKPFILKARVKTHIDLKINTDFLKQLSTIDGLTGIANRRRLDEFIEKEWKRALRQNGNHPLSVIMIDIDYFKKFNDGYGHQAGDDCLRLVATAIKKSLKRITDLSARYGGEEFTCILPETGLPGALHVAEKIAAAIEGLGISHAFSEINDIVTVSIGVSSTIPERGKSHKKLLMAADEKLYQAKNLGRNRICPKQ